MQDLAPMTFGMPRDAKFTPAKYMTQLCLQHSVAGAQWTAVVAEEIICALSGQPRTAEMALERVAANKALKLALRDYRTSFQVAYLAVIKATLACPWLGDTKKRNVFGLAADLLIRCAGGIRNALALTPVLEPIHLAAPSLWANAPRISQRVLDQTTSRFLNSVQRILCMIRPGFKGPFRNRITDVIEGKALPDGYHALEEHIRQIFDCYAAPEDDPSTMDLKFRLSLLIELCWVYAAAIGDPNISLAQLKYLEQQCKHDPAARITKKERLMRVHQMANVVSHVRREVLATREPSMRIECDFLVSQMEIDGYKIFDYETTSTRQEILAKLYAWFKQDVDGAQPFTANEIEVLKEEIRVSWCIQHGKPVDRRDSLRTK